MKSKAPVGQTCPDIDKAIGIVEECISSLGDAVKYIGRMSEPDGDLAFDIENVASSLGDLLPKRWDYRDNKTGFFEEMRTANGALRDWGNDRQQEVEYLEEENEKLKRKIDELEERLSNIQSIAA